MKSKRRAFAIFLAMWSLLALGCGGDSGSEENPTNEGPPPANLVGVWIYESVTIDGASADLADVLEWVPGAISAELQLWFESGFVFFNDAGEVDINVQMDTSGTISEMSTFTYAASDEMLAGRRVARGEAQAPLRSVL